MLFLFFGLAILFHGLFGSCVFQILGIFPSKGICQGQLLLCWILGVLGLRVLFRLGFSRFSCGMVGFRDFQRLQVLFGQGISQGQFRFRGLRFVQGLEYFCAQGVLGFFTVSQGLWFFAVQRSFHVRVYLRVSYVFVGLGFLGFRVLFCLGLARFTYVLVGFSVFYRLEVFSFQGISQGQLRLCRVVFFQGLEFFCAQGWLGLLTVGQGLGFFSVQRSFLVRVYIRVSYGCVGLRFFRVQSSFAPGVSQVCLRLGRVQGFSAFRCLFRLGYMLGLVTVFQGLGFFKFRVFSRLGLGRFAYGFAGLMVFQCLEVFSGQGISQGQLRLCRVQVFQGLEWFRA